MRAQEFCEDHQLFDPTVTSNAANGQAVYVGCNEIRYCFRYASPTLVEGDSGDVVFTFVLTDLLGRRMGNRLSVCSALSNKKSRKPGGKSFPPGLLL